MSTPISRTTHTWLPPRASLEAAIVQREIDTDPAITLRRNQQLQSSIDQLNSLASGTDYCIGRSYQSLAVAVVQDIVVLGHGELIGLENKTNEYAIVNQMQAAGLVLAKIEQLIEILKQRHDVTCCARSHAVLDILSMIKILTKLQAKQDASRRLHVKELNTKMWDNFSVHFNIPSFGELVKIAEADEPCCICLESFSNVTYEKARLRLSCCDKKTSVCVACFTKHAFTASDSAQKSFFTCLFCRKELSLYPLPLPSRKRKSRSDNNNE